MEIQAEIREICDDLYQITGIKAVLYDAEMGILYAHPASMGPFCAEIRRDAALSARCLACDRRGFARCRQTEALCIYPCHMGLTEAAAPILENGETIGYLLFGQLLSAGARETVYRRVDALPPGSVDKALLHREISEMPETEDEKIRAAARLISLCACSVRVHHLLRARRQDRALPIAEYIQRHLAETDLSIQRLCRLFGVSRGTLYHLSKDAFGLGITQYIRDVRVDRALTLLRETGDTVSAIAEKTGIGDADYLSRLIKQHTGKTPLQLRRAAAAPE